jgi:hypothetical protein
MHSARILRNHEAHNLAPETTFWEAKTRFWAQLLVIREGKSFDPQYRESTKLVLRRR